MSMVYCKWSSVAVPWSIFLPAVQPNAWFTYILGSIWDSQVYIFNLQITRGQKVVYRLYSEKSQDFFVKSQQRQTYAIIVKPICSYPLNPSSEIKELSGTLRSKKCQGPGQDQMAIKLSPWTRWKEYCCTDQNIKYQRLYFYSNLQTIWLF